MLGPLETICATIVKNAGPIGNHRPNVPLAMLGPSEAIGRVTWPIVLGPLEIISSICFEEY
jgi:hypothetical protein